MPHINLLFSLTIHDRTQLQIFELKFFTKSIFLSHFQIHHLRIQNSGFGSGFGRGSSLMRIRIHNTAQLYGIVLFSQSSSGYKFSFLTFRFLLQLQLQLPPEAKKIYKNYTRKAIDFLKKENLFYSIFCSS